jgi:CYTH domain-containing protein
MGRRKCEERRMKVRVAGKSTILTLRLKMSTSVIREIGDTFPARDR